MKPAALLARVALCARVALEPITSYLRERRIRRLCREAVVHVRAGRGLDSRIAFRRMTLELEKRSPQQVARMERRRNLARKAEA